MCTSICESQNLLNASKKKKKSLSKTIALRDSEIQFPPSPFTVTIDACQTGENKLLIYNHKYYSLRVSKT